MGGSFISAFVAFYLRRQDVLPYFVIFLFISVVFEWIIEIWIERNFQNNFAAYAIFGSFTVSYYLFLYMREIFNVRANMIFWIVAYLLFSTLNLFVIQGLNKFNNLSYNIGMLMVVVSVFLYFKKIIIQAHSRKLITLPLFWLGLGLISFYCSVFPVLTFTNRLMELDMEFTSALYDIVQIGNSFLASSFIMVVVCPYWIKS